MQQPCTYILYIKSWLQQEDKEKAKAEKRREAQKEKEEKVRAKEAEKNKLAVAKHCDAAVAKLSPSFVAMEVLNNDRRMCQVPPSFKQPFDELFSKMSRHLKEAANARKEATQNLLTIDVKGCSPIIQEARKLESVVKSLFSAMDQFREA